MIFHRNLLISIDTLDDIASDLLEISENTRNKDQYRNNLLSKRMKSLVSSSSLIFKDDIQLFTSQLRRCDLTFNQLTQVMKKLNQSLREHYLVVKSILKRW